MTKKNEKCDCDNCDPSPKLRRRLMDRVNEAKAEIFDIMDDVKTDENNAEEALERLMSNISDCHVHSYVGLPDDMDTKVMDAVEVTRIACGTGASPNDILMLCVGMLIQVEQEINRVCEIVGEGVRDRKDAEINPEITDLERAIWTVCMNVIITKLRAYEGNNKVHLSVLEMLSNGDRAFTMREKMFVFGDYKWALIDDKEALSKRNLEVLK